MSYGTPLISHTMSKGKKDRYNWINLKPAENGFIVSYDELIENPMESGDYNPDRYRYEDRTKVFEMDSDTSMDQALTNAVNFFKKLHMANLGMVEKEEKGS